MRDLEVFQGIYQVASFCKPAQVKSLSSILKALISSCPRTASLQYKCRTQNTAGFLLSSSNMGRDFYSRWSLQRVLTRETMLAKCPWAKGLNQLCESAYAKGRGKAQHYTKSSEHCKTRQMDFKFRAQEYLLYFHMDNSHPFDNPHIFRKPRTWRHGPS